MEFSQVPEREKEMPEQAQGIVPTGLNLARLAPILLFARLAGAVCARCPRAAGLRNEEDWW
jgi:hypothetical protein